jgi:tetratricopeptide (TPR) repeat protein
MRELAPATFPDKDEMALAPQAQNLSALPAILGSEATGVLQRMFRDPRTLESEERKDLISQLQNAVSLAPQVVEVRVMLGMALCVDLQAQQAMEELREAVNMEPDNFIARLKFGELLMRLRVCHQAAEHTQAAARLATNSIQSEMARRQAATLRIMMREGIERGGFKAFLPAIFRSRRKSVTASTAPVLVGSK